LTVAPTVAIDFLPQSVALYRADHAIVGVDVIRATTTAVTAAAIGWRCYPTPSLEAAVPLAARLSNPLLVGELGGNMPYGFDLTNSPAELAARTDVTRPLILLSTSGTLLLWEARTAPAAYAACLRNFTSQARHLADRFDKVAVIGAGSRGEFRLEDQLCCAWIAGGLISRGFAPANDATREIVERWRGKPVEAFLPSPSVAYLERTDQLRDLDFILAHVDDLPAVFLLEDERIVMRGAPEERGRARPPLPPSIGPASA
jgi:2-phosphosulfolactate phosphatase